MPARPAHQHVWILIGVRDLDSSAWGPVDQQLSVGFTFDKQFHENGIALDLGFYWSGETSTDFSGAVATTVSASVLELDVGAKKTWYPEGSRLRPYVGAGVALAFTSASLLQGPVLRSDDAFTPGIYGRLGLAFEVATGSAVGLDFHYLGGTSVDIGGINTTLDGWVGSVVFGWGF